jgi:hydroxypyruvate reductase
VRRPEGDAVDPRRQLLLELMTAGLNAVAGRGSVREALGPRVAALRADGRPLWLAAIGKAASSMALGAHDALGGAIERVLLVTKDGHVDQEARALPGIEIREAGHPVPDARSLEAGAALLGFIEAMPRSARPLFLISGGASSLAEALVPGVSLDDLRELNATGLASGMPIAELNVRRRAISRIKGGGVSHAVRGRGALALFISDVPGDDPAVIGSGLLGPSAADNGASSGVARSAAADDVERIVVASIEHALEAVRASAPGMAVHVSARRFGEDAGRLAVRCAHELHLSETALRVWGGESVMELPQRPGRGGRNQHCALAVARLIAGQGDLLLLAVGTDGTDGPTPDAGALVDGNTCARVACAGLDVDDCLRRADSATALEAAGDLVHTGPTGTNVGDLIIGLKLSEAEARNWLAGRHGSVRL